MNTNSFRREVLIGVGGFVAGVLVVTLALALWSQRPLGVQAAHSASGVNYVVVPKPAEVSFQTEFGLHPLASGQTNLFATRKSLPQRLNLFDMPRQQPWVAPYEFLIHPDQKR